jgi:hypothetical protein
MFAIVLASISLTSSGVHHTTPHLTLTSKTVPPVFSWRARVVSIQSDPGFRPIAVPNATVFHYGRFHSKVSATPPHVHHATPFRATSHRTTSHHPTPQHATLHHTRMFYFFHRTRNAVARHHATPHHITQHHTALHYATPHAPTPPTYTEPHYTTLHSVSNVVRLTPRIPLKRTVTFWYLWCEKYEFCLKLCGVVWCALLQFNAV